MYDDNKLGPRWPAIPVPATTPVALYESVSQLKAAVDMLTGQSSAPEEYGVDERFITLTKTVDRFSATVSTKFEVVINEYGVLAQRTSLIEAEITDARSGQPSLYARILEVDTARVNGDSALAVSLDVVEARVDDVSAGGFFKTTASVIGGVALAEMEARVYTTTALTATVSAGWRVKIEGGVGYFDIFTSTFRLIDTGGVARPVFVYTGGKFEFTGDVAIDGQLIINGTVYTEQVAPAAISQMGADTSALTPSVVLTLRAGAKALIVGSWTGDPNAVALYPATATGTIGFYVNGVLQMQQLCGFFQDVPSNPAFTYRAPVPTTYQHVYTVPSDGVYTFQMENVWDGVQNSIGVNILSVIELVR